MLFVYIFLEVFTMKKVKQSYNEKQNPPNERGKKNA
nr:MAG TPA: hypothetical protein [Caudoviricetes sp.]